MRAANLISPGFFTSEPVHLALLVGVIVAIVTALVGVMTVMRAQTFAGHALADLGSVGGAAALLLGVSQLWGFVVAGVIAAIILELVGMGKVRGRDVTTGIVFSAGLGLTALLLYLSTLVGASSTAAVSVLFGSLFVLDKSVVPGVIVLSVLSLLLLGLLWRRLQLTALNGEMASARGVNTRLTGLGFIIALALAVEMSSLTIGAVLSTALLVGPAASALRVCSRIAPSAALAVVFGVIAVVAGVWISYNSFAWTASHRAWPVSFCIVLVVVIEYAICRVVGKRRV